jgi:hypothetical protein
MAEDNVCLSTNDGLTKLRGRDAVLKFDGSTKVTSVPVPVISGNPIRVDFYEKEITSTPRRYILDTSEGSVGFLIRREGTSLRVYIYDSTLQVVETENANLLDGWNTVIITEPVSGGGYDVDLNGAVVHQSNYDGVFTSGSSNMIIGANVETTEKFIGQISHVSIGDQVVYNMSGQFGNGSLLDSSGNGYNGVLSNPNMWWWAGLDAHFTDWTVYHATLPVTPSVEQFVTVIDVVCPPDTDVGSWQLYANSVWLRILFQKTTDIILWLLSQEGENMTIDKTIRGKDFTAEDLQILENRNYKVWATTEVTIQVRLSKDEDYIPIVIVAGTPPLMLGEVHSINSASSDGNMDDLYLGYKD